MSENTEGRRIALVGDATWAECLCAEIDPTDVPCIVCEARELQGLPPCDALVFEYCGQWWEFAGYVEPTGNEKWDEQTYGYCLYGFPIDKVFVRPDLPGFIFNRREIMPLTPTMERV